MKQPEIRFKGFSDEWGVAKLNDVLIESVDRSMTEDEYDVLSSTVTGIELRKGRVSGKSNIGYKVLDLDHLVLSPQNLWLGNINVNRFIKGIVSPSYKVYAFNSDLLLSTYASYMLRTARLLNEYKDVSVQGASTVRRSLDLNRFYDIKIQLPSLPEQQKIGALFSKYDDIIALREQKLEELNALKKGLLQQMFSDGHKPQVRFSGFNDEWVERKLGDLAYSFEYGLNASAVEFDGVHKYIRITDIDSESRSLNEDTLTSPNICYDGMDKYLVKEGDILFARTGASVGKAYKYNTSDGVAYYAGFLIRMRLKANFDSDFVFQNVFTHKYAKFIEINSQRSGQPGVNSKEYSMFKIQLPSLPEQQKIGQLFKQLDDRISNEQNKIKQLKSQKQGLLQRML